MMNKTCLLLVVALFVATTIAKANEEAPTRANNDAYGQSRPNVIFLLADDQRDNSFGAMGHPFVKTPNV